MLRPPTRLGKSATAGAALGAASGIRRPVFRPSVRLDPSMVTDLRTGQSRMVGAANAGRMFSGRVPQRGARPAGLGARQNPYTTRGRALILGALSRRFDQTFDRIGPPKLKKFRDPNLKSMSIPRIGDILRGEPSLAQSAAASAIRMFQNAMGEYNGQRVRQGQRAIDFPGRYHHPKRVIRPKARSAG